MRVDVVSVHIREVCALNLPVNTTATLDLLQNLRSLGGHDKENMIGYPTLSELW